MTQDSPAELSPGSKRVCLDPHTFLDRPAPSGPEGKGDDEDWEEDPPRREVGAEEVDPRQAPEYLDYGEISERHLRLIERLIELTHPLAVEYLTVAQEVTADAPGRERIIGLGCKLVGSINQLMGTSCRVRESG